MKRKLQIQGLEKLVCLNVYAYFLKLKLLTEAEFISLIKHLKTNKLLVDTITLKSDI